MYVYFQHEVLIFYRKPSWIFHSCTDLHSFPMSEYDKHKYLFITNSGRALLNDAVLG